MKFLGLLILSILSVSAFAAEVNLDCYNDSNVKVLSLSGISIEGGNFINNYDNREEFNPNITDPNTRLPIFTYRNNIKKLISTKSEILNNVQVIESGVATDYAVMIKGVKRNTRRYTSERAHKFELKSIDGIYFTGKIEYIVGSSSRRRFVRESFSCNL